MQQDVGFKLAHWRLDGVIGRSQFRISRHRLQVPYYTHGVLQALCNVFVSQHGVLERPRTGIGGQVFQLLSRIA